MGGLRRESPERNPSAILFPAPEGGPIRKEAVDTTHPTASLAQGVGEAGRTGWAVLVPTGTRTLEPGTDDSGAFTVLVSAMVEAVGFVQFVAVETVEATEAATCGASPSTRTGKPGQANYAASKGGLTAMTKAIAQELASRNVTANCVAPGFIATAMTESLPDAQKDALNARIPMGRMGEGTDIGAAVAYLASREAGYITGQTIHVNGGMAML